MKLCESRRKPGPIIPDGTELRGFLVRAYPSQDQAKLLHSMQQECRLIWNYLVEQHREYMGRVVQRAVDDGVIAALPTRPEKSASRRDKRDWSFALRAAQITASRHVRKIEGYEWPTISSRADFYAPLRERAASELGRELVGSVDLHRSVTVRFAAARVPKRGGNWEPPRFKRQEDPWHDRTMLQLRDTHALVQMPGGCGFRGKDDCELRISGLRIPCRAGRSFPSGATVRGVSVVHNVDGWFASARFAMPPRELPAPTRGTVGVGFGLVTLCATSDGESWENPRGNTYTKLCAHADETAQSLIDSGAINEGFDRRMQDHRYQLRMARHVRNMIYTRIFPELAKYDTIVIGTVSRRELQGPQCKLGDDDDGGVTSASSMLRSMIVERFRGRVVQLDASGFSELDTPGIARKVVCNYLESQAAE